MGDWFPTDDQRSGIGLQSARHDFDKRALARAILPNQRMHLSFKKIKRDPLQGMHSRKCLGDELRFEKES